MHLMSHNLSIIQLGWKGVDSWHTVPDISDFLLTSYCYFLVAAVSIPSVFAGGTAKMLYRRCHHRQVSTVKAIRQTPRTKLFSFIRQRKSQDRSHLCGLTVPRRQPFGCDIVIREFCFSKNFFDVLSISRAGMVQASRSSANIYLRAGGQMQHYPGLCQRRSQLLQPDVSGQDIDATLYNRCTGDSSDGYPPNSQR